MLPDGAVNALSVHLGQTPRPSPPVRAAHNSGAIMKLLLIEDNAALQASLKRSFERRGDHVTVCADGARALDRWRAAVPDVVLLDLSLPHVDGLSILTQARAEGLDTPVIVLTARSTVGDRVIGLDAGADDYLLKPFDLDELEARLRAVVRRRGEAPLAMPSFHGLSVDAPNGGIMHNGRHLDLTRTRPEVMDSWGAPAS